MWSKKSEPFQGAGHGSGQTPGRGDARAAGGASGAGPSGQSGGAEYGDSGGPVGAVDPEAIMASQDAGRDESEQDDPWREQAEEWKAKYLHALADFQNFQRRSLENEREARRQGITSVVGALLGVLDIFDLALKQDVTSASSASILEGVAMIRGQMTQALASVGVSSIDPKPGDPFDPHRHEAVAHVPSDQVEPGTTAATFQAGYALGDRVLRPAKVSVAKPMPIGGA